MRLHNVLLPDVVLLTSLTMSPSYCAQNEALVERAWKIVECAWNAGPLNHLAIMDGKICALDAVADLKNPRATAIFREAITGSHMGVQFQAVSLLNPQRTLELLPEIKAILASERRREIRASFLTAVSKLDAKTALPILVPFAKQDGEKPDVDIAIGAFIPFGPGAADAYTAILASGCERCREVAAERLLQIGAPPTAVPALREALASGPSDTALYAAAALAALGDRSGSSVLKAQLTDVPGYQRDLAAIALCRLGDMSGREVLSAEIHSGNPDRGFNAARLMGRSGLKSLQPLLAASLASANRQIRLGALSGLDEGPGGIEITADLLADPDSSVRYMVAQNLLQRGDRQRADPVLRALSQDRDSGWLVLDMLANYGASTAAEQELALKELHADSHAVQINAVRALRSAGHNGFAAIAPLLEESPEPWAVRTVAHTLVEMSPNDAIPYLEQGMESGQQHVRILSAGYLLRAFELLGRDITTSSSSSGPRPSCGAPAHSRQ